MRNARLDGAQVGIKIAGRNINNLRYADDTELMAESEEELNLNPGHGSESSEVITRPPGNSLFFFFGVLDLLD